MNTDFQWDGLLRHDSDDHGDDHEDLPHEQNGLWVTDHIHLTSVGIDIGSAGTQVMFSRLTLRRMGEELSSRYVVTDRRLLYQSPVALTPFLDAERIDGARLGEIIAAAYAEAGVEPARVDTGAVILTGEAIRRQNAEAIATALSEKGGDFVCVTAGHQMEALLAAFGSGAAQRSYDGACRILNIDIGGGTTKLSVAERGRVLETAAIHVGGRLLALDEDRRIIRLEPGGRYIANRVGLKPAIGDILTDEQMERMAAWMAEAIVQAVVSGPGAPEIDRLFLTPPLQTRDFPGGVMFSGGVGEYVYDRESRDFGDLGRLLGRSLRQAVAEGRIPWPVQPAGECIRATLVGAAEHTVQVSGNTLFLSRPELLPRKNLEVLDPNCRLSGQIDAGQVAGQIRHHLATFGLQPDEGDLALAFRWEGDPDYARVAALARGINQGLAERIRRGLPLYLVFDADIARTIGRLLTEELGVGCDVVAIDGIQLQDFDYIDLGRRLEPSGTVPVTIKSLFFQCMTREGGAPHEHSAEASAGRRHSHAGTGGDH